MALSVLISEPALLPELVSALAHSECITQRVGSNACRVVHVFAGHPEEALTELVFFVRAWQLAHPGVSAFVTG